VGDELVLVELAGVDADRAHQQLAASLRELLVQPLERRASVAGDAHGVARQPFSFLPPSIDGGILPYAYQRMRGIGSG
jgi:hypothetical protein